MNGRLLKKVLSLTSTYKRNKSKTITLPFKGEMDPTKEYFLNVSYKLKTAEPFLEKGL